MSSLNTPFTPQRIVDDNILLSIPVYQRLFVWGEEQINKLLEDLYNASLMTSPRNYYIGAITIWQRNDKSCKEDIWEIVDGQQRLTTLTILFSVLADNLTDPRKKASCMRYTPQETSKPIKKQDTGVGPASQAWEACILPMY